MKRKRSFSETAQDRKLQKLSSSLANDIARSLSVDDVPSLEYKVKNNNGENPIPALRRISLTGTANPTSLHLEQWLSLQANMHNISVAEYQTLFDDKQKSLRHHLDLLQLPNQTFETLRENLSKVLQLADELSGDHTLAFTVSKLFNGL